MFSVKHKWNFVKIIILLKNQPIFMNFFIEVEAYNKQTGENETKVFTQT